MKKVKVLSILFGIVAIAVLAEYLLISISRCLPPPLGKIPLNMGEPRSTESFRIPPIGEFPSRLIGVPSWWDDQLQVGTANEFVEDIAAKGNTVWVAFSYHITRYDIKTSQVQYYEVPDKSNEKFVIYDILLTDDDNVWVLLQSPKARYTALGHYNTSLDVFEVVSDSEGTFLEYEQQDIPSFVESQSLVEDPDGRILMPFKGRILAYDPRLNSTEYLLPESFVKIKLQSYSPVTALLVFEEKVWFTFADDMDLRSVDLQTGELINYGHAPSILDEPEWYYMEQSYQPIAVDKLGRIWMGYFSILDLNKDGTFSWEKAPYSTHFIFTNAPDQYFIWAHLHSIYSSSNGDLWFNSYVGMVKYNAANNQWCKSTSGGGLSDFSAVTEDDKGNLWMVESNYETNLATLYKLRP